MLLNEYLSEYGNRKFRNISKHINTSKHTTRLLLVSVNSQSLPTGESIVTSVQSNIKYTFASGDTLLAASMLLLNNIIEKMSEFSFEPNDATVHKVESEILKKISTISYSGSSNMILKKALKVML